MTVNRMRSIGFTHSSLGWGGGAPFCPCFFNACKNIAKSASSGQFVRIVAHPITNNPLSLHMPQCAAPSLPLLCRPLGRMGRPRGRRSLGSLNNSPPLGRVVRRFRLQLYRAMINSDCARGHFYTQLPWGLVQ
ncbi:hypothetical protein XENTR_v10022910 [Xenopus tropicalis]|nr:hypothetical protein XENTR_v10022910 [Xenopus tropicalis]